MAESKQPLDRAARVRTRRPDVPIPVLRRHPDLLLSAGFRLLEMVAGSSDQLHAVEYGPLGSHWSYRLRDLLKDHLSGSRSQGDPPNITSGLNPNEDLKPLAAPPRWRGRFGRRGLGMDSGPHRRHPRAWLRNEEIRSRNHRDAVPVGFAGLAGTGSTRRPRRAGHRPFW